MMKKKRTEDNSRSLVRQLGGQDWHLCKSEILEVEEACILHACVWCV